VKGKFREKGEGKGGKRVKRVGVLIATFNVQLDV
jgi:hypothetical protein